MLFLTTNMEPILPTGKKKSVIIDEAHSSQGGETATDLKEVRGGECSSRRSKIV